MPVPAVLAVVIRDDRVLLVRRANPPDQGLWGFPGGKIEPGETIFQAARRELREETSVDAEAEQVFTAVDVIDRDGSDRLRVHFVLIAVLCRWTAHEPVAGDDAADAQWIRLDSLEQEDLHLSADVAEVARLAASILRRGAR